MEEATAAYMQASLKQSKSWIVIAVRIFSTLKQAVYDLRFTADRFRKSCCLSLLGVLDFWMHGLRYYSVNQGRR